jgi:ketosteroid isomerase-like protein
MPTGNVEMVRGFYHAVDRWLAAYWQDPDHRIEGTPSFEEVFERLDPEVQWNWLITPDSFRGRDEVVRALRDWFDTVSDWRFELEDLVEGTEGRVLATLAVTARGRESGAPARQFSFTVITVRGGKIALIDDYTDPESARAAAGLPVTR